METKLNEIHQYLIEKGSHEEELKNMDTQSVYLSMEIMEYAHRNQKRENGEDYANHPWRCSKNYRNLVGIGPEEHFCIDSDLMWKNGIPFQGVQELCYLHDVLEDSELTFDDVQNIFFECGFEGYFNLYIAAPLKNITHIKTMDYLSYILICMEHPTSALVKMLDMQDNINIFSLASFEKEKFVRSSNYLAYMYLINDKFHFIENIQKYLKEFRNTIKMKQD